MNKKRGIQIVSIVLVICLGWYGIKHFHRAHSASAEAVLVEAKKVNTGSISIEAKAVGTLIAARNVQITPETTGQVDKILVHDGVFVKQGTPLIQLDDKVYKAKYASTKANLFLSETNLKRMLLLGKQGAVSRQAIDQAQADLKEKQAQAQESQVTLEKMQLVAPFDGVLGKVNASPGEHVTVGQALISLTDIQHLRVEYTISEKFLSQLKLGQSVKVTTSAYPGKEFIGKVSYISATINAEDRTISVYAELSNEARLLTSGLFVNVSQSLGEQKDALLVPSESLVATIDGQQIYKIINNKVIAVPVIIGQRTTDSVQILQGLTANDVVVTAGQQKVKDGMTVEIKQDKLKSNV